jgi:hypothetical protein
MLLVELLICMDIIPQCGYVLPFPQHKVDHKLPGRRPHQRPLPTTYQSSRSMIQLMARRVACMVADGCHTELTDCKLSSANLAQISAASCCVSSYTLSDSMQDRHRQQGPAASQTGLSHCCCSPTSSTKPCLSADELHRPEDRSLKNICAQTVSQMRHTLG